MAPSARKPTRDRSTFGDQSGVIRKMKRKYPDIPHIDDAMRYRILQQSKSPMSGGAAMMKYMPASKAVFYSGTGKRKQQMANMQKNRKTNRALIKREPPEKWPLTGPNLGMRRYNINL